MLGLLHGAGPTYIDHLCSLCRYFRYNAHKPCPFWDSGLGKCASSNCFVASCAESEVPPALKYSKETNMNGGKCQEDEGEEDSLNSSVDVTISDKDREALESWLRHDEEQEEFCEVDSEECPDCDVVDLTLNPERYTGYSGEASHRIWRAIYRENCFSPPGTSTSDLKGGSTDNFFSAAFLQDALGNLCLEKRAFYRVVSGLHSSITVHLCANYLIQGADKTPLFLVSESEKFGPNLEEFQRRFDPSRTNGQGPFWLKNLYFVYLLELRALTKVAPYLESQSFYTGREEEDKETQIAVKELLNLMRSFPDQFDESVMFSGDALSLKQEFREHFRNISRVMDCVGCDKCRLWGKLQVTGLGTAMKILFSPEKAFGTLADDGSQGLRLTRNEIVALFNAFGRISTSINQLDRFREQLLVNPQEVKAKKAKAKGEWARILP